MAGIKKFIVITSIFNPTKAVVDFAAKQDYTLVVAGDKKSPADWKCDNVVYLDVDAQIALGTQTSLQLPFNHYCRKLIGYLYAMQNGAEVIIDTDDDNLPYDGWDFPVFSGAFDTSATDKGFINIYKNFSDQHIWPRGLPLNKILDGTATLHDADLTKKENKIGVWQGLADGDPDVDAIYRLVSNVECTFKKRAPIVLDKGTLCPYNSQNTATIKEFFPLLYLPAFVTFRFTDILRGLVAQPVLWAKGYRLGFTEATVFQERNPHNYMRDFESEVPMFLHTDRTVDIAVKNSSSAETVSGNLYNIYKGLLDAGIVESREVSLLELWLRDVELYSKNG